MTLYALDPGPVQSALVICEDTDAGLIIRDHCHSLNGAVLEMLLHAPLDATLVIERIASMGMIVGEEVFETIHWSGMFYQAWRGLRKHRLTRRAIKLHLCGSNQAKDANVRAVLLDRYGGKALAIGRKASPGPLYGLHGHGLAALAVAVTWIETHPSNGVTNRVTPVSSGFHLR